MATKVAARRAAKTATRRATPDWPPGRWLMVVFMACSPVPKIHHGLDGEPVQGSPLVPPAEPDADADRPQRDLEQRRGVVVERDALDVVGDLVRGGAVRAALEDVDAVAAGDEDVGELVGAADHAPA